MSARSLICFVVLLIALGCSQSENAALGEHGITRVDIYYRDFDSLSPISQSKDDLMRTAPIKLSINEAGAIEDFIRKLPDDCDEIEDSSENSVDYYLLARFFSGEKLKREFGSSGLSFVGNRPSSGGVCRLLEHDRAAIDAWIRELDKKRTATSGP